MKYALAFAAMSFLLTSQTFAAEIAAVRIHADWCPKCRTLDPKLEAVTAELGDDLTIRHVRLDYTKKDKDALWAAADEAEIRAPLEAYVGTTIKTGLLILIDEDQGIVVGKATSDFTEAELKGALRTAAGY